LKSFIVVLLFSTFSFATVSTAVEATSEKTSQESLDENPDRPGLVDYVNTYEYGLDVRQSTMIGESATFLQCQWNKRYWWGTWIGIGLGGTMESVELNENNNVTKASVIYGGFNIEQTIFRYSTWLKSHLGVFVGQGKLFARYTPDSDAVEGSVNDLDIQVIEPYIMATVYNKWGLEWGASFATRGITSSEKETVNGKTFSEGDYSGVELGISVRRGL
jgi:hypothetical protein